MIQTRGSLIQTLSHLYEASAHQRDTLRHVSCTEGENGVQDAQQRQAAEGNACAIIFTQG